MERLIPEIRYQIEVLGNFYTEMLVGDLKISDIVILDKYLSDHWGVSIERDRFLDKQVVKDFFDRLFADLIVGYLKSSEVAKKNEILPTFLAVGRNAERKNIATNIVINNNYRILFLKGLMKDLLSENNYSTAKDFLRLLGDKYLSMSEVAIGNLSLHRYVSPISKREVGLVREAIEEKFSKSDIPRDLLNALEHYEKWAYIYADKFERSSIEQSKMRSLLELKYIKSCEKYFK